MREGMPELEFSEYERKNFSAEDIFHFIKNRYINKSIGIKMIEGYGLRKANEILEKMRKGSGMEYRKEIDEAFECINRRLDEALESIREKIKKKNQGGKGARIETILS
jgi:hypothetical protein